ncbi:MAG: NnrS family protein [Emcibacter sp.]|nr:NnrS family protein [Emcibacter sp.]
MTVSNPAIKIFFSAPLWQSAFRPFYLLGVIYGLGIMLLWVLLTLQIIAFDTVLVNLLSLWHGHEMVFGFAGAVVMGFILTALPGWAGTREIEGGKLAFLVLLWLLGRVAFYLNGILPDYVALVLDSSLFFVAAIMLLPELLKLNNKHYLALLPIFLMLGFGNVIFYLSLMDGHWVRASWAIQIGLMGIVVKFIVAGGFLTTVFTGNALRQKGEPELLMKPVLEYISALSMLGFIYAVLGNGSEKIGGLLAIFAAFIQLYRLLRLRTAIIWDAPLVLIMHVAYLWFIFALILFGAASFSDMVPDHAWLHAFTVGALSLMMLSLITRVALRHTGRPLVPARAMLFSFGGMVVCAALRVMVSLGLLSDDLLPLISGLWLVSFLLYIGLHGLYLIRPSLPKRKGPKTPKGAAKEIL